MKREKLEDIVYFLDFYNILYIFLSHFPKAKINRPSSLSHFTSTALPKRRSG